MLPSQLLKVNRQPWDHQWKTVDRFGQASEVALFHEMGTGKTTSAILILRFWFNLWGEIKPTLILSPASVCHGWAKEFKEVAPEAVSSTVRVVAGSALKKKAALNDEQGRIFITNYETFDNKELAELIRSKNFFVIIADEAHRLKNPKSKRFKAILEVGSQKRMILTGSPMLNGYMDLWAQFMFLDRGATFSDNFFIFRSKYFVDKNAGMPRAKYFPNWQPIVEMADEITERLDRKASRIRTDECLDLPKQVFQTRYVEMSGEQRAVYEELKENLIAYIKGEAVTATNALVKVLRLLQVVSGYAKLEDGREFEFNKTERLAVLSELIEEITPTKKLVVWSTFQQNYKQIASLCDDLKIKHCSLTGLTADREKEKKNFFENPDYRVMIANPQAGGEGVNEMVVAPHAIYYSRNYSLKDRLQSLARTRRGGSEMHDRLFVTDLVTPNTLDEIVLESLLRKEDFAERVLEKLQAIC